MENLRNKARAVLNALESPEGELSLLIVDDPGIAELNGRYLGRAGPTNVMAFPMRSPDFPEISSFLLGDVVISAETAAREASEAGISPEERMVQLLVHGILHLFGYEHENGGTEALRMAERTSALLDLLDTADEQTFTFDG